MSTICYLCGLPITADQPKTNDHVIPATLIRRDQPLAKGFDYGSFLPTHEWCNLGFGPESYVSKALDLLSVLSGPSMGGPLQHRLHPDITILPLDASKLAHFTQSDLRFFKMIDAREIDIAKLSDPLFYEGKAKTNPTRDAIFVALSVLAKSAAALLVKRCLTTVPRFWRIYAQPYTGDISTLDFSEILGPNKPFDKDLRVWLVELPSDNWHVIYAAKDSLVFFTFGFNDRKRVLSKLKVAHSDAETFSFVGTSINEILVAGWRQLD